MYVVKVGEYYVSEADVVVERNMTDKAKIWLGDIKLSNVLQRHFNKAVADYIANKINGKVIYIEDQVTMVEETSKQLSIFDMEVSNE